MNKISITLLTAALLLASIEFSLAQTLGDYRSNVANGSWNSAGSWETFQLPGPAWAAAPTAPTGAETLISVRAGHNITMAAGVTATVTSQLDVLTGGTLTITGAGGPPSTRLTISATATLNNSGTISIGGGPLNIVGINVLGTFSNQGTVTNVSPQKLTFGANSIYDHAFTTTAGTIPNAAWNITSLCRVSGYTSNTLPPAGLNPVGGFGNFEWNCLNQTSSIDLAGALTNINGDLNLAYNNFVGTVLNGGNGIYNLAIGGNLTCSEYFIVNQGSGTTTVSVVGNVTIDDPGSLGYLVLTNSAGGGTTILDVTGNLLMDNFCGIDMSLGNTGSATINLMGNYTTQNFGYLTSGFGSGTYNLNFNGTSGVQTVAESQELSSINISVQPLAVVSIPHGAGTNFLGTDQTFTLNATATLQVGSTDGNGAIQALSAGGNIRGNGTRNYISGSTIEYNGIGTGQVIGNGHPTTPGVNITITNSNGVSIIAPTTLAGTINLSGGNLNINSSSLTISGDVTGSNGVSIGAAGSLSIEGSADIGTFPFTAGSQTFLNFTLGNTNGITFGNDVTITGAVALDNGILNYNDRILTLNGTITSGGGTLSGNNSSTLTIGGTGAFGILPITPGNSIAAFTFNRSSGTASLNSSFIVNSAFNLLNGSFTNTNGLQIANGATLTRASNGQLLGNSPTNLTGGQFFNLVYTGGSMTTGLELPSTADDDLGSLTITTSGTVSLNQPIIVNGNLALNSSTFSAGSNTITMRGSQWNRAGGNFDPGTGEVRFDGVTTIVASSGTPQFGNLRVESGGTLTFPVSTTAISGNATFIAGSTVNANGGTVLFNGSGAQGVGSGGATLNNITVTKAGGAVNLTSALNITGILDITTATVFSSAGNLTLLSTSDGTSGNASIASLAGGGSVTGDVTVQRFMSGEGRVWRYLSSPVQNATVASWKDNFPITGLFSDPSLPGEWPVFSPPLNSSTISMYRYNETTLGTRDLGWEAFPTTGLASANALEVGRGYSAFVRITPSSTVVDVTGPINSGDIALPVALTGTGGVNNDNGWNIVGNPYPSTIDWDSPNWTKTNISNVVQIRDDPGGIFQTWNGSIGSMGSGRIAAGQGFWVQAIGAPTLTARETVKTNTTGTFFKQDNQVSDAFEITLSKGTEKDFTYLWFKDDATVELDANYDAPKFNNDIFDLSILTSSGTKLAINTLPYLNCGDELKMDLSTANTLYDIKGSYTIEFDELGAIDPSVKLRFVDTYANSTLDISSGSSYAFEVVADPASFGSERFKLQLLAGGTAFAANASADMASCKAGEVTLLADGAPVGGMYKWYDSDASTTPVFESADSEFTTPALDKSKTYFVSAADDKGCESTRTPVVAQVINFDDVAVTETEAELVSSYETGNQWFKDGVLIPGANQQTFKPQESGLYKVEVTIESCTTSSERVFTVTGGLEDDAFFDKMMQVYPNPVTSELTFRTAQEIEGNPRILDVTGRVIGEVALKKEGDTLFGVFDFKGRAEGIYLLQVSDKKGQVFNKRIVKE